MTRMRCTTTCAALPASATTRACSTPSSPPFGSWRERRRSRGGSTRRNASENWRLEVGEVKDLMAKRSEKTVLFLCTGNYYRSRFAEVLFNSVAGKMGLPWRASSRGLALERGVNNVGPMAASAVKALEAMGVRAGDAFARLPAQVTADDLEGAALDRRSEARRTPAAAARALPGLGREGRVLARGRRPGSAGPDRAGGHGPRRPHPRRGQAPGEPADRSRRPGVPAREGAGQEARHR